jgi:acyl-CoA dehydrogenase
MHTLHHEQHEQFRATLRAFVAREIAPQVGTWDEAGSFPRELYAKAAQIGLLGLGYPEALGGTPCDIGFRLIATEEIARAGSGGLLASLFSHCIALPPIVAAGSADLQHRIVPPVLAGEQIAALAITEPGGGSDVAQLTTRARRDGDGSWVIDGEKTFITSGVRADWITLAARTGGPGAGGLSLFAVPGNSAGLQRTKLDKMGWWCSDTAHLRFDAVRVGGDALVGDENAGFRLIMDNFNGERLVLAAGTVAFAQVCFDEALDWARQRRSFGRALVEHQVIRHKLMDMRMHVAASRAWLHEVATRFDAGADAEVVADLCLLKNQATRTMQFCADAAVQILGGMGYMRGTKSERIYREVKVMMIGGGSEEIMKELAARQAGV